MNTVILSTQLAKVDCGECGGVYAITEKYREQCSQKGTGWTCPYCNTGWGYFGNSENERLKKELERAERNTAFYRKRMKAEQDAAERERHRANGYKGAMTKAKKRASAGVCPCCTRTFQDLARHMKSQHPEYAK